MPYAVGISLLFLLDYPLIPIAPLSLLEASSCKRRSVALVGTSPESRDLLPESGCQIPRVSASGEAGAPVSSKRE